MLIAQLQQSEPKSGVFEDGERKREVTPEERALLERSVAAEHEVHGRRR